MTPDDLAALLANPCACGDREQDVRALADALEQAWAERDRAHILCSGGVCLECAHMRARAERAEAALEAQIQAKCAAERLNYRAEAALARVWALCEVMRKNNGPYATLLELAIEGDR